MEHPCTSTELAGARPQVASVEQELDQLRREQLALAAGEREAETAVGHMRAALAYAAKHAQQVPALAMPVEYSGWGASDTFSTLQAHFLRCVECVM